MKPKRIEFDVGQTIHGQPLRLVYERGNAGRDSWTLIQDAANQRDDRHQVSGLDGQTIERMAEAVKSTK